MKVIHVIPGLSVRGGGGDRACAELAESQANLGHDVTIIHLENNGNLSLKLKGVEVVVCQRDKTIWGRFFDKSEGFKNEFVKRVKETDIVHIHALWRYINVDAAKICKKYKKPYVVQPHGLLEPWRLRYKRFRKLIWGCLFEKKVLSCAVSIHAESEKDRKYIQRYLPKSNVFVVPCGIYAEEFLKKTIYNHLADKWSVPNNKKVIAYLGRIDVHKGLDLLLKSFSQLKELHEDYHLLIIGPDYANTKKRLETLSRLLHIEKFITWVEMISEMEEKRLLFQKSHFFVLPSYSENFGITVLEALFSKCPVITTTETAWGDLVKYNAGIIVEPNVKSLSEGIKKMVSMSFEERKQMVESGFKYVNGKYDWLSIASATVQEYKKIVSDQN